MQGAYQVASPHATNALLPQSADALCKERGHNAEGGANMTTEKVPRSSGGVVTSGPPEDDAAGGNDASRCLVYCRLRPSNAQDFVDGAFPLVKMSSHRVVLRDERHYDYDGTFDADSTQAQVFAQVAVPCIQHALNGFCSALLCYGQTGTGKSFTMCNTDPGQEGIIPRAARYLFDYIAADTTHAYTVVAQCVQIYRDHLDDLTTGGARSRVDIHYDPEDGVTLTGCSSHRLTSAEDFMNMYLRADANRVVTATAISPQSSRGHTAMAVWIYSEHPDNPAAGRRRGKITFIDLAGYERFSKTGITNDNPIMKDEAKTINASLLSLGHVVSSLSSDSKHIPWRNAKLTRILQDSIGGRSRTSIILTVGPSSHHFYETTNTLQFGLRAMAVKVMAKVSVTVDYMKLAARLTSLLGERDERIGALELQLANRDVEREEMLDRHRRDREELEARFAQNLEELTTSGASEDQIAKLKDVFNVEVENLQEQQSEEMGYQDEQHSKEIALLVREQEREEAKGLAAMKLAQERLIEDFQNKLDRAREGTNADLIRALQQLSEKDTILASRANDTARLYAHIETLRAQVRQLGGVPSPPGEGNRPHDAPTTFLDISQVEEVQDRMRGEVERQRAKLVDLRAQLDRMSLICNKRVEELSATLNENQRLRERLTEAGVGLNEGSNEHTVQRAGLVHVDELESLRLSMQADLDEVTSERDELRGAVARLEENVKAMQSSSAALAAPDPALHPGHEPSSLQESSFSVAGSRGPLKQSSNGARLAAVQAADRSLIEALGQQLAAAQQANTGLLRKVDLLETLIAQHGISAGDSEHGDEISAAGEGFDVCQALAVKDEEVDALDRLLIKQEDELSKARSMLQYDAQLQRTLRAQVQTAGLTPEEPATELQPVEDLAMDVYMDLLRRARQQMRTLVLRLVSHDACRDHDDRAYRLPNTAEVPEADLTTLLEEKDNELELRDELILEKSALAQYMAKLVARLTGQMESLGLTPCCQLPEAYSEIAKAESEQSELQAAKQRELEEQLEHEARERARVHRLLETLSAERQHQATILSDADSQRRAMMERELAAAQTIQRLAAEKSQKERVLEEAARRATRELMALQEKMAQQQNQKRVGLFERLFRHILE